jgi:uncharacterized lipoprotein YddW (UPF0748 family)
MKIILKILVFSFIFNFSLLAQKSKSIWVVRDALLNDGISEIIPNAGKLNINKVFLQLRALGTVYFPTDQNIPEQNVDSVRLNSLFQQAKENNIEMHIWLNYSYVQVKNFPVAAENHILAKSVNSIIYSSVNGLEDEGYFLHPNDKSNLSEVKKIISELINNYEFKGIHLDYFRYPHSTEHYSNTGRTNYIIKSGLDPIIPLRDAENFIKIRGINSYSYFKENYSNFLRSELTEALYEIRNHINHINPEIELSIAVKPNPFKAKHLFYQDWAAWLAEGLCDFVVLMNYNKDTIIFEENNNFTARNSDPSKVIIGIGAYNINANEVKLRLKSIQNSDFNGYSLFSYNFIIKNRNLFNQLMDLVRK